MKNSSLTFILYFVCIVCTAEQTQAKNVFVDFGLSRHSFNYAQWSVAGNRLNDKDGQLKGGRVSVGYGPSSNSEFQFTYERINGTVEYDGLAQEGSALLTKTAENFKLFSLRFKRNLGITDSITHINWFASAAVNHRNWDRHMQEKTADSSLRENYIWDEFDISLEAHYAISDKNIVTSQAGSITGFNETLEVDINVMGAGKPKLQLGSVTGQYINLGYKRLVSTSSILDIVATYQYWHFDRSDDHLVDAGLRKLGLSEPESKTHQAGVKIQFRMVF